MKIKHTFPKEEGIPSHCYANYSHLKSPPPSLRPEIREDVSPSVLSVFQIAMLSAAIGRGGKRIKEWEGLGYCTGTDWTVGILYLEAEL